MYGVSEEFSKDIILPKIIIYIYIYPFSFGRGLRKKTQSYLHIPQTGNNAFI